ncbi:hypothetical protein JHK87_007837 [Glycine soja]|nr:hypothetical protein JHK87_007837 [Glycine soja]
MCYTTPSSASSLAFQLLWLSESSRKPPTVPGSIWEDQSAHTDLPLLRAPEPSVAMSMSS